MITLTGTFTRLDGSPATGTVRVTPSRSPIMDSDGKIVISGPQTFPLDGDGTLSVTIPASNDPDLGPAFTYSIDVNLTHASWKISKVWIPHVSTTVDLSEIADYTPVPGVATRVVTIPADGTDGQVLVWDGAGFTWADSNITDQLARAQQLRDEQEQIAGLTGEDEAVAFLITTPGSLSRSAVGTVAAQTMGQTPVWVVHADNPDHPRPDTSRPVEWFGTVEPTNMADSDLWHQYEPPYRALLDFSDGTTGWTQSWDTGATWTPVTETGALEGAAVQGSGIGRSVLLFDDHSSRDVEVVTRAKIPTPHETAGSGGVIVRASMGPNSEATGHGVLVTATVWSIGTYIDGDYTRGPGAMAEHSLTPDEWYYIRLRAQGSQISAKLWRDSDPEPTEWDISFTTSRVPGPGHVGLLKSGTNITAIWDRLGIAFDGETAPKERQ